MQINAVHLALGSFGLFFVGYRWYSRLVADKVFGLDPNFKTPAHEINDGVDYVPTNKHILFGHHFTSVAGAAPIIGPAIAVIWGWLPALLWIVFGTVFMGAVHDFGTLVLSAKNKGKTIAELTGIVISPRTKVLFLLVVVFLTWLVLAVFAGAIGSLFQKFPGTVLPINIEILVSPILGYLFYKKGCQILWPSIIALIFLYVMVWVGAEFCQSWRFPDKTPLHLSGIELWVLLLLIYSFIASLLPVWMLLQPRDYINSHQLIVGLGAMYICLFILHPTVSAPAIQMHPQGGGMIFPMLFVTVACGAISGFHGLVSSGTTSKQLDRLPDARSIGYGSMIGEGLLAVMSVIACTAGLDWVATYSSIDMATAGKIGQDNFVRGGAGILEKATPVFFTHQIASTFLGVIVISFAATTLDTACRIQRFVLEELGGPLKLKFLKNRYISSAIAAFVPLLLVLVKDAGGRPIYGKVWPIFGASNQMLAAISLLVLTVYLARKGKPVIYTYLPFVFITIITSWSMILNILQYVKDGNYLLIAVSGALLFLSAWIIVEGYVVLSKIKTGKLDSSGLV